MTLTLIFLSGSWEVVWLACLAVEAGCGERVCFFGFLRSFAIFCGLFIKTFHLGGLKVCGFGW